MKTDFWLEKWQNQQTGFHKDFTHPLLIEFIDMLNLTKGDTIFVPLCGKTLDMLWLNAQGYKVIGVEVSRLAIEQFFSENNLSYKKSNEGNFILYTYENITIYLGDFFDLQSNHLRGAKVVYDRAALIALPEEMVVDYVNKIHTLMPDESCNLLITLEFNKTSGPIGPPFTTSKARVNDLYANFSSIKLLYEIDIIEREKNFADQGCKYVYERVYLIKK